MENLPLAKWTIDPVHSEVAFKIKHMMISSVKGYFGNFDASLEVKGNDFENAKINVSVSIDSINTKNEERDSHLKSNDFFNADVYPKIRFVSTSFDGSTLKGDLTIRSVTKRITLDVEYNGTAIDQNGQTKAGFEISGEINRKDFGLTWDVVTEAGGIVVADKLQLIIDAQFIKLS